MMVEFTDTYSHQNPASFLYGSEPSLIDIFLKFVWSMNGVIDKPDAPNLASIRNVVCTPAYKCPTNFLIRKLYS